MAPRMVTRWLARDRKGKYNSDSYILTANRPTVYEGTVEAFWTAEGYCLRADASEWHALGGLRLRPGQGPVRVEVRVEVRRVGRKGAK